MQIEKYVVIMQSAARGYLARRTAIRQSKSALRIQSLWRGYCVRKVDTKARKSMRERVKAVNAKFEQRILL